MMKWILLVEVVVAVACFAVAWQFDHGGTRTQALNATIPFVAGVIMIVVTILTGIGWAIYAWVT